MRDVNNGRGNAGRDEVAAVASPRRKASNERHSSRGPQVCSSVLARNRNMWTWRRRQSLLLIAIRPRLDNKYQLMRRDWAIYVLCVDSRVFVLIVPFLGTEMRRAVTEDSRKGN